MEVSIGKGLFSHALRRWLTRAGPVALLCVWALALLFIGSILMAAHWVVLPKPSASNPVLANALGALHPKGRGQWQITHVLYAQCRCSQRIHEYLAESDRPRDVDEVVLLVDSRDDATERLTAMGFPFERIRRRELSERFGIDSAPLLLIADPDGQIRYSGGYTGRKQGLDYKDLELLASVRAGAKVEELPVYGCGVSRELQRSLDPIGIIYDQ